YPALELLIVDNGSEEPQTHALFGRLRQDPRVRIIDAPGPFNFSALNNRAAAEAKGEILLLLNNDIEMREPHWLTELVAHAVRPNVGAAGAKLLYPDGRVQHGGVLLGIGVDKVAGHCGHLLEGHDPGPFGRLAIAGNASAVTGACLAMRREVFEQVGGLDEQGLKVSYNDVDLCLKVRAAGYDIVWTPWAELVHHESASRGLDHAGEKRERFLSEVAVMRERWGPLLDNDPFFGPCLDNLCGDFRLADPPTRTHPWVAAAE
ncbi:MAG TPA: glycosyltransferase family 2 protein, partial [Phenylobacterium sp.]